MRYSRGEAMLWIAAYVTIVCSPLLFALLGPAPPARGFAVEFGVALGFIALGMFWAQFALTARFQSIAGALGTDAMLQFHRQAGILAYVFLLAHPALLIAANPGFVAFLDPRASFGRAAALIGAIGAATLIITTTLWRIGLGIRYDVWRWLHAALSIFIVFVGFVHVFRVAYYIADPARQLLVLAGSLGAFAFITHTRLLKPWQMKRAPWRVAGVSPLGPRDWSIVLEPIGHEGIAHAAGQFAWISFGGSPFLAEQHPFSIASPAGNHGQLELAVRELGDFTGTIGSLSEGEMAWVDGPHGAFVLPDDSRTLVLVAGGIGISPLISMLRTLARDGDRRRVVLRHAAGTADELPFRSEIDALRSRLDLDVVRVVESASPEWREMVGRLDGRMLASLLPDPDPRANYLICGPDLMMDAVERYLREAGVPAGRIDAERFNIA